MKTKIYTLLILLILSGFGLKAQDCDFTNQHPSQIVTIQTGTTTISQLMFAGEYSHTTGYVDGKTYTFSSSTTTDYITLRNECDNSVLLSGSSPLDYVYTLAGDDVEIHVAANDSCDAQSQFRALTVDCATDSVPDCASIDFPLDQATNLPVEFTATWTASSGGSAPDEYDVSLGTDPTDLDFYGSVTGTDILINGLDFNTIYYWSVTPINDNGEAEDCEVLSFATTDGSCGSITLTTQTEVNNFSCASIDGDLIIMDDNDGIDDIIDLDPIYLNGLQNSTIVTGNVIVENCGALPNFIGLDGIGTIGGDLIIRNNGLNSTSYTMSLTEVGGSLIIEDNPSLPTIQEFVNLGSVGQSIIVQNNDALMSMFDFDALAEIGATLYIYDNNALESITSFGNLATIGYNFDIRSNPALTTIEGFENLSIAGIHFFVLDNPLLVNIPNFDALTSVGGIFHILNTGISAIDGFSSLSSIGGNFILSENQNLTTVNAFGAINAIDGDLSVYNNNNLSDCCWLAPLINDTQGSVSITSNATSCETVADITGTPPEIEFVINLTGTSVRPTWFPVVNADRYRIQWRLNGETEWNLKATMNTLTTIINLEPETFYEIRLASRVCGIWGDYGEIGGFETSGCLSPDKNYDESNHGTNHKVVLVAVDDADRYQIRYKIAGTTGFTIRNYNNGDVSRNLTGLQAGSVYEIETRTRCNSGVWTPFEAKEGFETSTCVPPSPISVTHPDPTEAEVVWEAQENASNYQIRYRIQGDPNWIVRVSQNNMRLLVDLESSTNYIFQMRARCPTWTEWSGNHTFTTPDAANGSEVATSRSISHDGEIDLSFGLYPNPSNGQSVTIDFENDLVRVQGVEIYDLYGNVIQKEQMDDRVGLNKIEIDLKANLPAGQYVMRVFHGKTFEMERFMIIK